jgi:hypothetical protein
VLTIECQRCGDIIVRHRGIEPLQYREYVAGAVAMTIGSIRFDTRDESTISYRCRETGVERPENKLYPTEEAALEAATVEAEASNAVLRAKPERISQMVSSTLDFCDAIIKNTSDAVWNAWYSYRQLREDMEEIAADDAFEHVSDIREAIGERLLWESTHRDQPPLGRLLDAALVAVHSGDLTMLRAFVARMDHLAAFVGTVSDMPPPATPGVPTATPGALVVAATALGAPVGAATAPGAPVGAATALGAPTGAPGAV